MAARRGRRAGQAGPRAIAMIAVLAAMVTHVPASSAAKAHDLLPNLVALPVRAVSTNSLGACQPIEMVEQNARRCLRYEQVAVNDGDGALELRYELDGVGDDRPLVQRIERSDGSHRDRVASSYVLHPAHAHFHYVGFAQALLWQADSRGRPMGDAPVREGRKNGFCLMDVERHGDGPTAAVYTETGCKLPNQSDLTTGPAYVQGISRGWADVYSTLVEGQFIEITGLPDGMYVLEVVVDPDATLVETSVRDNSGSALIEICATGAQLYPPTFIDIC